MKLLFVVLLAIAASATAEDIKCIPLSIFSLDCNTCYCSKRGEIEWCTLKSCQSYNGAIKYLDSTKLTRSVTKESCKPDTVFKDYCNTCRCGSDGRSAGCTIMACDKDSWNPDGTLKISQFQMGGKIQQK